MADKTHKHKVPPRHSSGSVASHSTTPASIRTSLDSMARIEPSLFNVSSFARMHDVSVRTSHRQGNDLGSLQPPLMPPPSLFLLGDHDRNIHEPTVCVGDQQHMVCVREHADHSASIREGRQVQSAASQTQIYRAIEVASDHRVTEQREAVITTRERSPHPIAKSITPHVENVASSTGVEVASSIMQDPYRYTVSSAIEAVARRTAAMVAATMVMQQHTAAEFFQSAFPSFTFPLFAAFEKEQIATMPKEHPVSAIPLLPIDPTALLKEVTMRTLQSAPLVAVDKEVSKKYCNKSPKTRNYI